MQTDYAQRWARPEVTEGKERNCGNHNLRLGTFALQMGTVRAKGTVVLTIMKMSLTSVDNYAAAQRVGTGPHCWATAPTVSLLDGAVDQLGVEPGSVLTHAQVRDWFNGAIAPSGLRLGRAPGNSGVPGFGLTFAAPKSVSLLWAFGDDGVRRVVETAHAHAVSEALNYLLEHAGYTRRADADDRSLMVIDRVIALTGVRYDRFTSLAGDPHMHACVLLANRQPCADGKWRALDGVGLYHQARGAGMLYQAILRAALSERLGVQWGVRTKGCGEIAGLDNQGVLDAFSSRSVEMGRWIQHNDVQMRADYMRIAGKRTRNEGYRNADLYDECVQRWSTNPMAGAVRAFVSRLGTHNVPQSGRAVPALPPVGNVLDSVTIDQDTFTRGDVVETIAELMPVHAADAHQVRQTLETHADVVLQQATPVPLVRNPKIVREGAHRFTVKR